MSQKRITELTLRANVDSTVNFPVDDSTQSYRVTAEQISDFVASDFTNLTAVTPASADHLVAIDASDSNKAKKVLVSSLVSKYAARYTTAAGQSIANGAAPIINFGTADYDENSAVTTGASWKYTAPVDGKYGVKFYIEFANASFTANGGGVQVELYKNGSLHARLGQTLIPFTGSVPPPCQGGGAVNLVAGDYIDLRVSHNNGSARSLATNAFNNWVCIEKIS